MFKVAFPGVQMEKQVTKEQIMKITISSKVAARAMYSYSQCKMIITFWYEPNPFPLYWIPNYRPTCNVSKNKCHALYWQDKVRNK